MILHISDKLPKFGGAMVATLKFFECSPAGAILCEYVSGPIGKALGVLFPVNITAFFWSIKIIQRFRPSVVHLHKINTLGIAPILAARLLGVPVVWSIYDYWMLCPRDNLYNPDKWEACPGPGLRCLSCYNPWGKRWPWALKLSLLFRKPLLVWAANLCTRVIAISHASRKLLIKHGVCAHKIAVIRIGTPAPIKRKITKVKGLLVCIAAFGPAKGAHRVFDLVTQHRGISRIYIAGSGGHTDYKFYLHELKRESKIPTIIEYEPDDKRVSSLLQMAEYVAVLEQWENPGPLIIGEAINSGAKVLWVDRGGIRECVEKVVSMDEMKEALRCLYLTVSQA